MPTDKASFLTVDKGMGTAMPGPFPALNEAEQMYEEHNMAHVMHNVLEPPFLYNFLLINLADGVVGHQTRFVRPICPWLLVVNDICDFIIVRSWAVLFDMVAQRS